MPQFAGPGLSKCKVRKLSSLRFWKKINSKSTRHGLSSTARCRAARRRHRRSRCSVGSNGYGSSPPCPLPSVVSFVENQTRSFATFSNFCCYYSVLIVWGAAPPGTRNAVWFYGYVYSCFRRVSLLLTCTQARRVQTGQPGRVLAELWTWTDWQGGSFWGCCCFICSSRRKSAAVIFQPPFTEVLQEAWLEARGKTQWVEPCASLLVLEPEQLCFLIRFK